MVREDVHEFRVRIGKPAIAIYNVTNGKETGDTLEFDSWQDAINAVDQLRAQLRIQQDQSGWLAVRRQDGR
jgi:hypothetical protein